VTPGTNLGVCDGVGWVVRGWLGAVISPAAGFNPRFDDGYWGRVEDLTRPLGSVELTYCQHKGTGKIFDADQSA
jgi:hypothetical protein